MNIIRAEVLGFCMGVRRAIDLACEEVPAGRVYTYGPLIHNPPALADLKHRGIEPLDTDNIPDDLRGAAVIIRAHGVSPQVEVELHQRGALVINAPCPRVRTSQRQAVAFAKSGYRIFLAGEEYHAEIIGLKGYVSAGFAHSGADPWCAVVSTVADAEKAAARLFAEHPDSRTVLIGQTTISEEEYRAIGEVITAFFPNLDIAETICPATSERQESLRKLLDKVDAVIIAGGKDSANTRRLYTIAQASGKPCVLAENPADIPPVFFAFNTIGLASGASTPDSVIDDIERMLKQK
jgi:4-hydroxy-3-methylbut-2-enyl diphosphate reductase